MFAERRLVFISNSSSDQQIIKVAIGPTKRSATIDGLGHLARCLVHTGSETAGEHEVYGIDSIQALCNGLTSIDFFLKALSTQGTLSWEDGTPYNPKTDAPFSETSGAVYSATLGDSPEQIKQVIEKFKVLQSRKEGKGEGNVG